MRWLIDCEVTGVPWPDDWVVPPHGLETLIPPTPDDPLVEVPDEIPTLRVYRLMNLRHAPRLCLLRSNVITRLMVASHLLPEEFGLVVLDGWRPLEFQVELMHHYEGVAGGPVTGYVADPSSTTPPPHTTGGAVDLTLSWRGAPLGLGTDFDDFTAQAAPTALETGERTRARSLRRLLALTMRRTGFVVNPLEWWHWSVGDQEWSVQGRRRAVYERIDRP